MIQSPWEQASALVTTEREGVRTHRQFALTSTQQSIDVPIGEADIPNLYVSVLLVKGRTKPLEAAAKEDDPADPGKPSFRLGYCSSASRTTRSGSPSPCRRTKKSTGPRTTRP